MADVDRRPVRLEQLLDDVDRADDAGAEAARSRDENPLAHARTRRRDGGRCPLERGESATRRPRRSHSPARLGDESPDDRSPGDATVGSRGPRQRARPDGRASRTQPGPLPRACRWQRAHRSPCRQRPRPFGAPSSARSAGSSTTLAAPQSTAGVAPERAAASPSQSTEPSSATTRVAVRTVPSGSSGTSAPASPKLTSLPGRSGPRCAQADPDDCRGAALRAARSSTCERAGERDRLGIRQRSVHARLRTVSLRLAVVASVAEGSKPQWIPQCSHRGSFPGPYRSHSMPSMSPS